MVSCEGCGGELDAGTSECPYCGRSVIQSSDEKKSFERDERTYRTSQDDEGLTHIQFGDGQTGRRLPTGDQSTSEYRAGGGSAGNVSSAHLEHKLDQLDKQIESIPDPSKHRESKDAGVSMLESMSVVSDILSMYQSGVSREAHLSTDDRDRLSKKEEKVKPKLRSMVAFCERADSKTRQKMGLSEGDIHKIKTSATRALQMMESGTCSRCGSVNKPGTKNCQNCGSHL